MKDSAGGLVICYLLYHQLGTRTLGGDNQFATGESGNKRKQVPYLPQGGSLSSLQHEGYGTRRIPRSFSNKILL